MSDQDKTSHEDTDEAVATAPIAEEPAAEELTAEEPIAEEPIAEEPAADPEVTSAAERSAQLSLAESAAAWVPPWARALPDLVIEPAADDPIRVRRVDPDAEPSIGDEEPIAAAAEPAPEPEPEPILGTMDQAELRSALEAIMLVVDEPVAEVLLAQVLDEPTDRVAETMRSLAKEYADAGRGFELRRAAGGWRLYTRAVYAPYVERFVLDGQQTRLTQAALETLAVVAYKQPVTRSRISAIRGVNCDGVLKTLIARGLVEECGQEPDSGAFLYRTTPLFLEKLGINGVDELPGLAPFLPDDVNELDGVR